MLRAYAKAKYPSLYMDRRFKYSQALKPLYFNSFNMFYNKNKGVNSHHDYEKEVKVYMRTLHINDETGEVLNEYSLSNISKKASLRVNKAIVEEMIINAGNDTTKIDLPMLYSWCKMCRDISNYNQMKIGGLYQNSEIFKIIISMSFGLHILRCLETANKYSCFMKRSPKLFIENWKQLFETVEITDKRTQQKVKKFLLDNKLVREYKHIGRDGEKKTKFIVNPFVYRRSTYIGEIAISQFQDFIKEGENMSRYLIRLLQGKEVIDFKIDGGVDNNE